MGKLKYVFPDSPRRDRGDYTLFLAGPIQHAPNWQSQAMTFLEEWDVGGHIAHEFTVASPRRMGPFRNLSADEYNSQVDWEHEHLNRASTRGVILFWLALPEAHDCSRPYAQTSRFELGEAVASVVLGGSLLVVGIEPGFSNERYLRRTIASKAPHVHILDNLRDTVNIAVMLMESLIDYDNS